MYNVEGKEIQLQRHDSPASALTVIIYEDKVKPVPSASIQLTFEEGRQLYRELGMLLTRYALGE